MDVISQYYRPFDVVRWLNDSIRKPDLKLLVNWILFLVSGGFVAATIYALIQSFEAPTIAIELYLALLGIMLLADVAAVYYEGKGLLQNFKNKIKPKTSAIVSIVISFTVGFVTSIFFKHHWHRFIIMNCTRSTPDALVIITIMKMIVSAVICYKAGEELRGHYRK
jgi:membrane protease YdiL (CAAX protease family)